MSNGGVYVVRKRLEDNFTTLPNDLLRNSSLSWKARGLLVYMLSMPTDWVFYDEELAKHSEKDGISSIKSAVKELKEAGYMKKVALRDSDTNKIIKWVTYVQDYPHFKEENNSEPEVENLPCGKPTMWKSHPVENQQLLSTYSLQNTNNKQNTNNTSFVVTPPVPDKSDKEEVKDSVKEIMKYYQQLEHLPKVIKFTPQRQKSINARIQEFGIDNVKKVLKTIDESTYFRQAKVEKLNWYKFEWTFKSTTMVKALEGQYNDRKKENVNNATNQPIPQQIAPNAKLGF